jgi:hypothetical protein
MKVQLIKLLIFLSLLGGFYACDGFDNPTVTQEDYRQSGRMTKAWLVTVIMFVAGALMVLWGNAIAQHVDWDVPDGLYPIIGALLVVTGFFWMLMVRGSTGT